jgi:hypothetical protein
MPAAIQFLNHASVLLTAGETSLVSDPWYQGAAFDRGWDLLEPDPTLGDLAATAGNIWLSHEHPDHFAVDFFRDHPPGARILFQKTRNRRVANFLEQAGWHVTECPEAVPVPIGDATLTVGRRDFYDSWSLFDGGGSRILNLNDCAFGMLEDLMRLRRTVGQVDVLLTQFSYAGWQGGRDQRATREAAARERLRVLALQAEVLKPRWIVPFASFIRFSHDDNAYLNDATNSVAAVAAVLPADCQPIVMRPRDRWVVGESWDNRPALAFWRDREVAAATAPRHKVGAPVAMETLTLEADAWRSRLARRNHAFWMRLARITPMLGALRPVAIRLSDLDTVVEASAFSPLRDLGPAAPSDAVMASESLSFIFRHEFGYDTLVVNGRFEAGAAGFRRMRRLFALGSLNAAGLSLGPSLLFDPDIMALILRGNPLKQREQAPQALAEPKAA